MIAARQGIIARQNNLVDITLYSSQGFAGLIGYLVFYSTSLCSGWNAWSTNLMVCPDSDTCAEYFTRTQILSNTTIYITVKDCSGTFIQFNAADNTNTCPANEGNYCYDYDECVGTVFSFNSGNVNKNIAIKVYVINIGGKLGYSYVACG